MSKKRSPSQERADALNVRWQLEKKAKKAKGQDKKQQSSPAIQIQVGKQQVKPTVKQSVPQQERSAAIDQVLAYEKEARRDLVNTLSSRLKKEGLDLDVDLEKMSLQQLLKFNSRFNSIVAENRDQGGKRNALLDFVATLLGTSAGLGALGVGAGAGLLTGAGLGSAAGNVADSISAELVGFLASVVDALNQIIDILKLYAPALREIIDELGPALKQLKDLVVEPYLGLVKDAKATMQKFKEDAEADRLGPDSLTHPISGPWQDWKRVSAISTACNLPIIGLIVRSELGVDLMARYQTLTGRGWPSDYEMLQWAAGQPGMLGPAMDLANMIPAGKIPAWFLKN